MKRRRFILGAVAAISAAGPVVAASLQDVLVHGLREQGFSSIKVGRTFLGRTRIIAQSPKYRREIILNPRTGEILRDYWEDLATGESRTDFDPEKPPENPPSGETGEGDDDDHDDDHDDDDDDDGSGDDGDDDDDDGSGDDGDDDDDDGGGDDHDDDDDHGGDEEEGGGDDEGEDD